MSDADDIARRLADAGFVVTIDHEVESAGAAALLGVTPKTLRNWRADLAGPNWRVRGRIVLYAIADLIAWRGTLASLSRSISHVHSRGHEQTNRS